MSSPDVLLRHLQLCDELHQLALEENRFLKEQQRAPEPALLERRRDLLARLDESLAALRPTGTSEPIPADRNVREQRKEAIEKSRTRILQILHLQRENEQLVLRFSLGTPKVTAPTTPPPASQLQKLYDRHR